MLRPLELIQQVPEQPTDKPPLLFIHGAWHGAWCWKPHFIPYFAERGYPVYALSLRGHGESWLDDSLRFVGTRHYIEDVNQVVREVRRQHTVRPIVIGHSLGGYVIQKYLEDYAVPGAVLLATLPVTGFLPSMLRLTRRHPLMMLKVLLQMRAYPMVETAALAHAHFFSESMPRETVARYHAQMQDESIRIAMETTIFNLPNPKRVRRVPMLVVAAEDDAVFTVPEEAATARVYNADLEIIPDLAHDAMLDANWRAAADCIEGWLISILETQ
jgi:pimeloyl-ACP methyl ester carboxylesterase